MKNGYWFKSEKFEIEKGEDEETNPYYYGKALANWLCQKFSDLGYDSEVVPEDWGWCVMCVYRQYLLWVGCGTMQSEELIEIYDAENPPKGSDVIWHVFTDIELPFFMFKSLFLKWTGKLDLKEPLEKLNNELAHILTSEPDIHFCEEP